MKCPKCKKGELEKNISYKKEGSFFKQKFFKVYVYFCPLCDYHIEKKIQISLLADWETEMLAKHK